MKPMNTLVALAIIAGTGVSYDFASTIREQAKPSHTQLSAAQQVACAGRNVCSVSTWERVTGCELHGIPSDPCVPAQEPCGGGCLTDCTPWTEWNYPGPINQTGFLSRGNQCGAAPAWSTAEQRLCEEEWIGIACLCSGTFYYTVPCPRRYNTYAAC